MTYTDPTGKEVWIEYDEDIFDSNGKKTGTVRRSVQVVFDHDRNLVARDKNAGNNKVVKNALSHLNQLNKWDRDRMESLVKDNVKHWVTPASGSPGSIDWNMMPDGTVLSTTSSYDPDANDAVAVLTRQLFGAAYTVANGEPYLWNIYGARDLSTPGAPNWFYYETLDGDFIKLTGLEREALRVELAARTEFNMPNDDMKRNHIPDWDKEYKFDMLPAPVECKGLGCDTTDDDEGGMPTVKKKP